MFRFYVSRLTATFLMVCSLPAFPDSLWSETRGLKINLRIHNYAQLDRNTLASSANETAKIFRRVGIEMTWADCSNFRSQREFRSACSQPPDASVYWLNVLPESMVAPLRLPPSPLGFSAISTEGRGTVAYIFFDRIKDKATGKYEHLAKFLGHAAAHEIGHLLLGRDSHSPAGIMHGDWTPQELQFACWGMLGFTSRQARLLRSRLMARLEGAEASPISLRGHSERANAQPEQQTPISSVPSGAEESLPASRFFTRHAQK